MSSGRTYVEPIQQRPIARWNTARDVWESGQALICGHWDVYSETFPTSGMTLNGVAYELPTWVPPMDGSGSSSSLVLLSTPDTVPEAPNSGTNANRVMGLGNQVKSLLPTPTAQDSAASGGSNEHNVTLTDAVVRTEFGTRENDRLLPTPSAADGSGSGRHNSPGHQKTLPGTVRELASD